MRARLTILLAAIAALPGCLEDPQYVGPPPGAMWQVEATGGAMPTPVQAVLPMRLERADEATERAELATELGVMVPFVKLEDIDASIEWTIKNLVACDARVAIEVDGANELFGYDHLLLQADPEEPPPPPLMGYVEPIFVPASGTTSGVFREDQVREASIDLELITRAMQNPFRALLQIDEDIEQGDIYTVCDPIDQANGTCTPMPTGQIIPLEAFGHMIRFDVAVTVNPAPEAMCGEAHVVVEFNVRVRDHRGILHDELNDAVAGELTAFNPTMFNPLGL